MKTYNCFYEAEQGESFNIEELFYLVKECRLVELLLGNGYIIRQRKDLDMEYTTEDYETFNMSYGKLYCARGDRIESVWNGRGEKELEEWIEICEEYI